MLEQKILVTGGTGFVGSNVINRLRHIGYENIVGVGKSDFNIASQLECVEGLNDENPDIIVHLAGQVGGIGANAKSPADFMMTNLVMGMNVIRSFTGLQATNRACKKLIMIGTVCSYPSNTPVPFQEDYLWNGYPEETNAPYGIAKKTLMEAGIQINRQFGNKIVNLIPVNMYGPLDNFDLETSHVIPAMIRKVVDAKNRGYTPTFWGTGEPTREFLYAEDLGDAISSAITTPYEKVGPQPINIGTGKEISMRDLANQICEAVGYEGDVHWDDSRPNGQMRRCLDTTRAKNLLNFEAETSFAEGLRKTIEWYEK